MSLLADAKEVRSAIAAIVRDEVRKQTSDCFRVRKATVYASPNSTTGICKVQLIGDVGNDTILSLPYSSAVSSVSPGAVVWVAVLGNSMRNAIVWETANFR